MTPAAPPIRTRRRIVESTDITGEWAIAAYMDPAMAYRWIWTATEPTKDLIRRAVHLVDHAGRRLSLICGWHPMGQTEVWCLFVRLWPGKVIQAGGLR